MNASRILPAFVVALALTAEGNLLGGLPALTNELMEKPALDVLDVTVAVIGSSRTPLPKGGAVQQSVVDTNFEFTRRIPIRGPWYFALGVSYEGTFFSKTKAGLPDQLQGIAGILALQYLVEDHVAATIELRPGVYAGGEITSKALDVPVLIYAPIPLRSNLFLVIGARESGLQNPPVIPIGGLIWLIRDDLRLEAVFPQSKLVYSPDARWEYRLNAEITGDGFRVDRDPDLPPQLRGAAVEYSEYRAGAGVSYSPVKGTTVGLDAGYVFERSLDFFRARQDLRSEGSVYLQFLGSLEF